jgi:hypothetical protein
MNGRVLGRRAAGLSAAVVVMLGAAGVAYASIPDSTTGKITACYNKSTGAMRVADASGALLPQCSSTEGSLIWNAGGPTMHWVKTDAAGNTLGKSDYGTVVYNGAAYTYFSIPNVDPAKCAITVQPTNVLFSDGPITTSYQLYGSYVYARAQQHHANGTLDWYPKAGLDVVLAC